MTANQPRGGQARQKRPPGSPSRPRAPAPRYSAGPNLGTRAPDVPSVRRHGERLVRAGGSVPKSALPARRLPPRVRLPEPGHRRTRVVLAAGTLGTNEILLRSRDRTRTLPHLSRMLGVGFSGNGDFLGSIQNS